MTIRDKYFGWKDIFFDRFVHCCNEKSDQPQGSNIPLAKINFDNKTGYVEDGTINIAELLQYLWINNKVYGCEYAPIDISSVLQTLIRLTENAKHMFEDQPGIYDMIPYRGFFLRDDFSSGKDYSLDLDKIVSGMGGWYGEDEDPCYSMFVSQDQIWNLNPILKVLADEGSILAKELGYDMNSYVSDNGYTIYNPYLSWINHYYHYCPTFNEDKLKPWDKDIHPPKGHKNWWEDVCDPVPRSTMKLKFKTELRDDYKQEMVNAEQRDIQHKTDKRTYR